MKLGDKVSVVAGAHAGDVGIITNLFEDKYIVRLEKGFIEIMCFSDEIAR